MTNHETLAFSFEERAELLVRAKEILQEGRIEREEDFWEAHTCKSGREFDLNVYDCAIVGNGEKGINVTAYLSGWGGINHSNGSVALILNSKEVQGETNE